MGRIFVGISGWRYTPWRGVFYPETLAPHRELEYASRVLPTIEINGSLYSLQRPQNYAMRIEVSGASAARVPVLRPACDKAE